MTTTLDHSILTAALEGLEQRRQRIEAQIAEIRAQLGSSVAVAQPNVAVPTAKPARRLSAAGRKRIADAARKRWAALRAQRAKEAAAAAKPAQKAAKKAKAPAKPAKKAARGRKPQGPSEPAPAQAAAAEASAS